ncbi:MAG TPA: Gfo/Idh/MocA family oxidoreductase [Pseudolysinimonas sp.]|nr:Gfo/Idh/MocA family oxidoreductase [Pseudolysinimonas sp.]
MTHAPLRIALVGAGTMGAHHARVINDSASAELAVLVDPREDVAGPIAAKFGATWTPELTELTDIDAVVVAAATEAHHDLAMSIIDQQKPLLIEKPVADSLLKTERILDAAEKVDLPFMCGLLERFNPAILTARAMDLHPFHVTATRHSPYASRIRTGVAWDLLVHDVDLAGILMGGEPTGVSAQLGFVHPESLPSAEDVAEVVLTYGDSRLAQISASRVGQRKVREFIVYEHDRMIEIDLLRRGVTIYRHISENSADGEGRGYKQQTVIEIPEMVSSREPLTAQFEHFVALIEGRADATAERASILPSHRIIERVTQQRPRI